MIKFLAGKIKDLDAPISTQNRKPNMFIPDHPIDSKNQDALKRVGFAENLANGLLEWEQKESLIIALNGKWGSGKTSIVNLMKEYIGDQKKYKSPFIFEFNPWIFSDSGGLTNHFFSELSKSLVSKNRKENRDVADKLRRYSNVLDLKEYVSWSNDFSKLILPLGVLGISFGQLVQVSDSVRGIVSTVALIAGFLLIFAELARISFRKVADFVDAIGPEKNQTALEIKADIKASLFGRSSRLLVIVDDMDRLSPSEILEIFRLIRINADFPNTTYLLAFDREIIEKSIENKLQVPGRDYLEKIIQVSFDIPFTKDTKILEYFFTEIDKLLKRMPKKAKDYFSDNDTYWPNVFHSGLKHFFNNIRDIKRYASSLNLNIALINKKDTLEINPIDFFVVEALRVFVPKFYQFMKENKELFLHRESRSSFGEVRDNSARESLDKAFNDAEVSAGFDIKEMLTKLFPQLQGLYGNHYYDGNFYVEWSRKLRICTEDYYDAYFTMTPGGDEEEISQFEFNSVLDLQNDRIRLAAEFRRYIEKSRHRKLFSKLEYYASDKESILPENYLTIILALFDIADEIPKERTGFGDFGPEIEVIRIAFKILKSSENKNENTEILLSAINGTTGLFAPTHFVRIDLERESKNLLSEAVIEPTRFGEIKSAISEKVKKYSSESNLFKNIRALSILYFMKELGENQFYVDTLKSAQESEENFVLLLRQYVSETSSFGMGDYTARKSRRFDKENAFSILDKDTSKAKLISIRENNSELYNTYKSDIDFLLNEIDREPSPFDF